MNRSTPTVLYINISSLSVRSELARAHQKPITTIVGLFTHHHPPSLTENFSFPTQKIIKSSRFQFVCNILDWISELWM
ncbi:unnamed protein product [Lactuca virosa]|uniref:Uncharacterized protein n=1 Tax=Lactuca virosa TaxID=75947 RepID=A0AAU9PQB0_9ASTR|nr:unnamed protein product [Lactuca virosa]